MCRANGTGRCATGRRRIARPPVTPYGTGAPSYRVWHVAISDRSQLTWTGDRRPVPNQRPASWRNGPRDKMRNSERERIIGILNEVWPERKQHYGSRLRRRSSKPGSSRRWVRAPDRARARCRSRCGKQGRRSAKVPLASTGCSRNMPASAVAPSARRIRRSMPTQNACLRARSVLEQASGRGVRDAWCGRTHAISGKRGRERDRVSRTSRNGSANRRGTPSPAAERRLWPAAICRGHPQR